MTVQRTQLIALLSVLTLALLALTPMTTSATASTSAAGIIVENRITSASIDPVTSVATLGGEIQCAEPTLVTVYSWIRQWRSANGPFAESFGGTQVLCDTTPTGYTMEVTPGYESDRLVPGPASVGFWASYCAAGRCYGLNTEAELRLLPRR
ncbi:MAG TPA: hypothetical protein PKD53_06505 [Chloroflexaceae bacterium]|nr:hypothetical protein [Chloroflexaceae bacterium]